MANTLRPYVSSQTLRYISSTQCLWLDGDLFNAAGHLYYVVAARVAGKEPPVNTYAWAVRKDGFGFFTEQPLEGVLQQGVPVNVRDLKGINPVQYRQLSRLLTLLTMAVRAQYKLNRCTTCIRALAPIAGDPFTGLRNQYGNTGRADRDNAARRA